MPLMPVTVSGDMPQTADGNPVDAALSTVLAQLPPGAPVIVMIHGYKHSPSDPAHSPHTHMLSLSPIRRGRCLSWPRHLGFGKGRPDEGLAIALGWEARGTIWQAYRQAGVAGTALARLVARIRERHDAPVDVVAHSLGARVALSALPRLPARSIGRVILISGAELRGPARHALGSAAGRSAEVLNVTSRENAVFDLMFERLLQPPYAVDRALGRGLPRAGPGWADLRIDCDRSRKHLARIGFRIPPPSQSICHWSGYMRPGLFRLYTAFLRDRAGLPLRALVPGPEHDRTAVLVSRPVAA